MGHEHVYGRRARHFSASGTEYFLNLMANGMSSQNAAPPARPPFQTGLPGWLSFDNKHPGGGVLEAAVQAHLQVRPLPPYLKPSSMGQLGVFPRSYGLRNECAASQAKWKNAQLPSRSDRLCCQKAAFHSPQVSGWLVIRCRAWLITEK